MAYLALLGALGWQARVALTRTRHAIGRSIVVGCCGIIGAVAAHNLFEDLHVLHLSVQLAAVWGLMEAMGNDGATSDTSDTSEVIPATSNK
ncbi:MAG: hypothetical protein HC884_19400 [Chloroflexaceae bacterium]|nr:hypothetical protein [Chloroflexaceae bacterium]